MTLAAANDRPDSLILTIAVIVGSSFVCLLLLYHARRAKKLIERWAMSNGLKILSRKRELLPRSTAMFEVVGGDQVYRVTVERPDGFVVSGWIRCNVGHTGRYGGRVDAKWEESRGFPVVMPKHDEQP